MKILDHLVFFVVGDVACGVIPIEHLIHATAVLLNGVKCSNVCIGRNRHWHPANVRELNRDRVVVADCGDNPRYAPILTFVRNIGFQNSMPRASLACFDITLAHLKPDVNPQLGSWR